MNIHPMELTKMVGRLVYHQGLHGEVGPVPENKEAVTM